MRRFRAPGSRIEHFTRDDAFTLCGKSARNGARYGGPGDPPGRDVKLRPICTACREHIRR